MNFCSVGPHARSAQSSRELQGNIREEIGVQLAAARVELNQTTVDNLVAGIAANIDYAFELRWRPRWVKDGDAHRWTEGSESRVTAVMRQRCSAPGLVVAS